MPRAHFLAPLTPLTVGVLLIGCGPEPQTFVSGEPLFECGAAIDLPVGATDLQVGARFAGDAIAVAGDTTLITFLAGDWLGPCEQEPAGDAAPEVLPSPSPDGLNRYLITVRDGLLEGPFRFADPPNEATRWAAGLSSDGEQAFLLDGDAYKLWAWDETAGFRAQWTLEGAAPGDLARVDLSGSGPSVEFESDGDLSIASAASGWMAEPQPDARVAIRGGAVAESFVALGEPWSVQVNDTLDSLTLMSRAGEESELALSRPSGVGADFPPQICLGGSERELRLFVYWQGLTEQQATATREEGGLRWSSWTSALPGVCIPGAMSRPGWGRTSGSFQDGVQWEVGLVDETPETLTLEVSLSDGTSVTWTHNAEGGLTPVGKTAFQDLSFTVAEPGVLWVVDGRNALLFEVPLR